MTGPYDREAAMAGLTRAMPYIRLYKGRAFVIKLAGSLGSDFAALRQVAEQIGVLREVGIRVVVVHGAVAVRPGQWLGWGSRRASSTDEG